MGGGCCVPTCRLFLSGALVFATAAAAAAAAAAAPAAAAKTTTKKHAYLTDGGDVGGGNGQGQLRGASIQQGDGIVDHGQVLARGVQAGGRAGPAHVVDLRDIIDGDVELLGWAHQPDELRVYVRAFMRERA